MEYDPDIESAMRLMDDALMGSQADENDPAYAVVIASWDAFKAVLFHVSDEPKETE